MEAVIAKAAFCTCICLGSVSVKDGGMDNAVGLAPIARDSRVIQMMLILRAVTEELGQTMHVIAENNMDQTSSLALGPHTEGAGGMQEPDFINTQAIIARCLVMNLAYPEVWKAHQKRKEEKTKRGVARGERRRGSDIPCTSICACVGRVRRLARLCWLRCLVVALPVPCARFVF
jgi:hypothetical protein